VDFGAGTHTVTLQANGPGYGGCVVCGEVGPWASGYSDCNLTLHGVYQ
jgi:hypothetical protein